MKSLPRRLDFSDSEEKAAGPALAVAPRGLLQRLRGSPLLILLTVVPSLLLLNEAYISATRPRYTVDSFNSCSTPACKQQIPRIIHQTYKSRQLPEAWAAGPALWNLTHPDWRYEFWDDDRNRAFIAQHYPWFLEQFDAYPHNIQRADAIRYFILYHHGGVYVDMDIQPVRDMTPLLGDARVILPETPNLGLTNAFMASVPRSDFMHHVMQQLPLYANKWYHFSRHWKIMTSTGPTFIWKVAAAYSGPDVIMRVPASVWGKCVFCAGSCPDKPHAYFHHLHGDSWHHWDSWFFNSVLFCHKYTAVLIGECIFVLLVLRQHTAGFVLAHRDVALWLAAVYLILTWIYQG